ncbi:MAG: proton-conducting transporter membrane subunit, partial [Candidatus Sericytochromatia bacterium]
MSVLWLIGLAAPWLVAIVLVAWPRPLDRHAHAVAVAGAVATAACLTVAAAAQPAGGALLTIARQPWLSALGWEMLWVRDGLSTLFGLLVAWIATLVTVYASAYLPHAREEEGGTRPDAHFYALLSAFTGSVLGLVSAGGLIPLYAFWELTAIASFLLIGYWQHQDTARSGATKSLMLTTTGSLGLLGGLLLLGGQTGHWELSALLASRAEWAEAPWLPAVAALVVVGALAKSAQMPFSNWLPAAMAAPTPVSAFLHSSALVAAGIYLLARFFPMLAHQAVWTWLLVSSGLVGVLLTGFVALRQASVKALLAYSTVSQYAFICLAFGLGTVEGAQAGLYAFAVHAVLKAGLFLTAGAVAELTGQKTFDGLGGLARTQPFLAVCAATLALSLGGVPLLGGFYYKEELLHAAYDHQAWVLLGAMAIGGVLTILYMLRFLHEIFVRPAPVAQAPRRLAWRMGGPIAVLALASLASGLFPNAYNTALLDPAIASVVQSPAPYAVELKLGGVLLLSLAVLALGTGIWAMWRRGRIPLDWFCALPQHMDLGGRWALGRYAWLSERLLALQGGNLRQYLRWEILSVLALAALCLPRLGFQDWRLAGAIDPAQTAMLVLVVAGATATLWLRRHVLAVIALTISGYSLAVVFALMHAPDVALAQVLVETLATLSIVMALRQSRLVR